MATRGTTTDKTATVWTDEERAAMQEHAKEVKAEARRKARGEDVDNDAVVLAKIAEMPPADRVLGERIHALVRAAAPGLEPKLWYGMPAYAREGKVVCFFQSADKFKARYATFGFDQTANLDEGAMWATSWAITALTPEVEARITALVKQAVS